MAREMRSHPIGTGPFNPHSPDEAAILSAVIAVLG
jgi:hypothetical protein